ncbi:BQ2448_6240 [Microbotryum intermedium]|uniref:BQ2448_6240 protein n=1 Tax=Microbotryum intermedium TaxID=269621 RepID=A0A238FJ49_9BASI|nr:BQ2448_6240 [Microbotryum intermedium]
MANIAIDFVGPLPTNKGFDCVLTITDRVSGYVRLLPTRFHEGWHRLFSLPQSIVSDCDKLFTSKFWATLHKCLNVKLQLSSAFHPEMDGRSKKTNKTAFQILRALINKEQSNWMECLAVCEYAINSSLNVATGKTPFELVLGYMPSLAPLARATDDKELPSVEELLSLRFQACEDARDQLAMSKVRQAVQSNKRRQDEPSWAVGDLVLLDSSDRRKRLHTRQRRAAKLMDRFDGPYRIVKAQPEISSYTLQLNGDNTAVPFFHTGKLKTYHENNATLFPNREPAWPGPVDVGGEPGYVTEDIVNERTRAGKRQYLVLWVSWPSDSDSWEPAEALDDTEALDWWEHRNEEGNRNWGQYDEQVLQKKIKKIKKKSLHVLFNYECTIADIYAQAPYPTAPTVPWTPEKNPPGNGSESSKLFQWKWDQVRAWIQVAGNCFILPQLPPDPILAHRPPIVRVAGAPQAWVGGPLEHILPRATPADMPDQKLPLPSVPSRADQWRMLRLDRPYTIARL